MRRLLSLLAILCVSLAQSGRAADIVLTESLPPYNYIENGEVTGLSTIIVREGFRRIGRAPAIEVQPWRRAFETSRTKPGVFIYSMARNPEREGDFRWVGRLVEIKLALSRLRRREELDVGSLEQARSKGRVLTLAGDATLITLRALGFGDESLFVLPDRAPTTDQRIRLLEMGRAEYWISNPFSQAWRLSRGERVGDLVPVVALPGVEALYLAAHPDTDPRLVDALTAAFAEMERDGTSAAVRQRYAPP